MENQFKCDICGASYKYQPSLSRHQNKLHGNLTQRRQIKLQRELGLVANELAIAKLQELITMLNVKH